MSFKILRNQITKLSFKYFGKTYFISFRSYYWVSSEFAFVFQKKIQVITSRLLTLPIYTDG